MLGNICEALIPIPEETRIGNPDSPVAVCTLSSIRLFREIANSDMLGGLAIVGRLFSENRGIDALVRFVNSSRVGTIVLCGMEVRGHRAGDALLRLCENGIDGEGRIISSTSPDPFLHAGRAEIERFRGRVRIVNRIGETDPEKIRALLDSLNSRSSAASC